MLPLPGLSPVGAKKIIAQFDGGLLSSDAGVLVLREVEQRLRVAERVAACIVDPRAPEQITHTLADIICFRLLMIAGGYEDGNDANSLRVDPVFKMAHDLSPSERDLCSQSTISRLENLPDARALLRMGRVALDLRILTRLLGVLTNLAARKSRASPPEAMLHSGPGKVSLWSPDTGARSALEPISP